MAPRQVVEPGRQRRMRQVRRCLRLAGLGSDRSARLVGGQAEGDQRSASDDEVRVHERRARRMVRREDLRFRPEPGCDRLRNRLGVSSVGLVDDNGSHEIHLPVGPRERDWWNAT